MTEYYAKNNRSKQYSPAKAISMRNAAARRLKQEQIGQPTNLGDLRNSSAPQVPKTLLPDVQKRILSMRTRNSREVTPK